MNKIIVGKSKTIYDPNSEFMRELEIQKHKLEIKPRKVNMMASQTGIIDDFVAHAQATKKLYIPNSKGGFL